MIILILPLFLRAEALPEYSVKLAYIYNIMKFIYWQNEDIKFCISGLNPFGKKLKSISDKKIQDKKILLLNSFNLEELKKCDIIFISKSERYSFDTILETVKNRGILTISDIDNFAKNGGMIELKIVDEKVKIFVNLKKVNEKNLKVSAKLLEVAIIVK